MSRTDELRARAQELTALPRCVLEDYILSVWSSRLMDQDREMEFLRSILANRKRTAAMRQMTRAGSRMQATINDVTPEGEATFARAARSYNKAVDLYAKASEPTP